MSWDVNVRDTPEKFRASIVGEVEWGVPSYSFDTTVVLIDELGRYYVASDSGCSCPSPFESFDSLDACEGPLTAHEVGEVLKRERAADRYLTDDELARADMDIANLMARVMMPPKQVQP